MFTLDDLYEFYNKQNKTCVFNSKESNSTIIVQIPEVIKFSDDYDPTYNLLPVHLMSCHLMENRNKSSISEKAMKQAIPSFKNRPILGYIQKIEDEDGGFHYDFAGHEMEMDENGNVEYTEAVVGVIPESCNPKLVYHDDLEKTYLEVDGFVYEDYTHAAEILRDKGECDVSIEIAVDSLSFDAENKLLNIDEFHFLGVTILGVTTDESHEKIEPGMIGSNITISDFSAENNSFVFNKQDIIDEITNAVLNRLNDKEMDNSIDYTNGKEVSGLKKEQLEFEETEVKTTEEVVATDTPDVVEDEVFEEEKEEVEEEETDGEVEEEPKDEEDVQEEQKEADDIEDGESEEEVEDEAVEEEQFVSDAEENASVEPEVEDSLKYSVTVDGVTKEFAVSLRDKINAVAILVNDTYAEADNAWYDVDVYEDDGKYCVMHDWWSDRHFKQEYSVKKDIYSLKGDRVQVFAQYLTQDQINQLDKMKSDFSAIETELNSYKEKELHTQREEVINSEDYSVMADFAEFKELKEHMDDYSIEDLTKEADLLYAKFMKSNYSTFAAKPEKKRSMVFMTTGEKSQEERLPYGGLFKNFKGKNN